VKRLGKDAYLLTSSRFQEPFFNRACFVECGAVSTHREEAEKGFSRLGLPTTITVNLSCTSAVNRLEHSGYRAFETMTVMVSTGRFKPVGSEFEVRQTSSSTVKEWSQAYLLSFYGEETLLPAVTSVVRRVARSRSATLLEARLEGTVAGVLAIYRTPGLAGIYCVGTVPKFRRRGVAGALLCRAAEIAASEGRRTTLQTLKSDGAEAFYLKRGFAPLYAKAFMRQES
jgi:ribosomal protein S18 acetylase RimI-like enzyme